MIEGITLPFFKSLEVKRMNKDRFHDTYTKGELQGIFVFVTTDCATCKMYFQEMKKRGIDTSEFVLVDCLEDLDYYAEEHWMDDMPTTVIYVNNEIKWKKSGVLFDKQLREFADALKGLV